MDTSELILFYKLLRQHGLNDSHSGNASIRIDDNYLVTKTGACADTLNKGDIINCDINTTPTPTAGASLDAGIHQQTYQQCSNTHAILHAHNPYTIALTMHANTFEPVDFEGKLYFGKIPVIACEDENYLEVMPERISQCLKNQPVAIVQSHGVYSAAENLELAYKWLCSLEQSAKIQWLARQL